MRGLARWCVTLKDCGRVAQLVEQCPFKAWVAGSSPAALTIKIMSDPDTWVTECTGYIGDNLGPKGLSSGSSTGIEIEVSQIIIHKADQPNIVVNFFNADRLAGEDGAEVNLFVPQANATAVGDDNDLVVEGIVDVGQSPVRAGGGLIDLGRALHG